jgi:aldehyde:ferredoxin oxidoreductase
MIVFTGKASEPVNLWIDTGRAELHPAAHLWGENSNDADLRHRRQRRQLQPRRGLPGPGNGFVTSSGFF